MSSIDYNLAQEIKKHYADSVALYPSFKKWDVLIKYPQIKHSLYWILSDKHFKSDKASRKSKHTKSQILEIKSLIMDKHGKDLIEIADKYNIELSTLYWIKKGIYYKTI